MDMREHRMGYRETVRKYWDISKGQDANCKNVVQKWKRIYLEEESEGPMKERRGRACSESGTRKSRPPESDKKVEGNLIAENQRLQMEIEYLKTRYLSSEKVARGNEKATIVNELRQRYPLNDLLQLSGLARSAFYYYLKHLDVDKYEVEKQVYGIHLR